MVAGESPSRRRTGLPYNARNQVPTRLTGQGEAMRRKVKVDHLEYDALTLEEAREVILVRDNSDRQPLLVVTPNLAISALSRRRAVECHSGDVLVLADGAPIVWMSRLAGAPLPERVPGSDLLQDLLAQAEQGGTLDPRKVAIIGGSEGAAANLAERFRASGWASQSWQAPASSLADRVYRNSLHQGLRDFGPDITLIGIGHPRQEELAGELIERGARGVFLCIGMAIDYSAGRARRAPVMTQKLGAEWLWRLAAEPRRLAHRYLVVSLSELLRLFAWAVRMRILRVG